MPDSRKIENLLYIYAERMDAGDYAGIGELFAKGRIVAADGSVLATGADEVDAMYAATARIYPETGTPLTKHVTTNAIIEVGEGTGDSKSDGAGDNTGTATSRSFYTVLQKTDTLPLQPVITGRYHDTFAKNSDGSWHFTERKMIMDQMGDLSQHLLMSVDEIVG